MKDINNVVLVGRLTRDAILSYTTGGAAVCKFSIASNTTKKDGDRWIDEANFFEVVLWGRQGEALNQYLLKGKQVAVQGELKQDRWEQDGQNRSKVYVKAENIQLLGGGTEKTAPSRQTRQGVSSAPQNEGYPEQQDFPDDPPF